MCSSTPWLLVLGLVSCTPDPEPSDDSGTDTDSGSAPASTFEATSTRTRTVNGVETCTESYDLVGTPYTGDCPDCVFAFDLENTPVEKTGDCPPDPHLTWAGDALTQDIQLALAEEYQALDPYGPPITATNAVLWGTSSPSVTYYGGTAPSAGWQLVGYEGASNGPGAVTWDGETLELDTLIHIEEFEYSPDFFQECGPFAEVVLTTFGPTADTEASVQCDMSGFDAWEFQAGAGSVVRIWVDNLPGSPEEVLTPQTAVTDAEACMLVVGGPSFPCTNAPAEPPGECPGLEVTIPSDGTWRVLVVGESLACNGGSAGYVLRGNLDGAPLVFTPIADDAPTGSGIEIEEHALLVAHVAL